MKVAIIGLGYVGLPLSILLAKLGYSVFGVDNNLEKIKYLKKGQLPFAQEEPKLKNFFEKISKKRRISFGNDFKKCKESELVFIAVDTPMKNRTPNYKSLVSAISGVAQNLKKGSIVIIESTLSPKTTKNIIIPLIEKKSGFELNKDFFIAVVPERIRPNHIFEQLMSLSRVIGVSDDRIIPRLKKMYSKITSGDLDFVDLTTAEVVKTVENAFRDVNIAFANEIAMACENLGVNVWKTRELVNKSPFHNLHSPGSGVGGHCIPKDPWLLISSVKNTLMPITKSARKINDSMPLHVFNLMKEAFIEKNIFSKKAKIAILGYSYVVDSDDTRNSPTESFVKVLRKNNIKFKIHDPFIKEFRKFNIDQVISGADAIVIMVAHSAFNNLNLSKISKLMRTKIIIDGRNMISKEKAQAVSFLCKGIGNV